MAEFKIIAITPESPIEEEDAKIEQLLQAGFAFVHLRHPGISEEDTAAIISAISEPLRRKVKLHDYLDVATQFGAGVHFNSRNPVNQAFKGPQSASCHRLDEVDKLAPLCNYVTLSPIFDSLSKQGYKSRFSLGEELRRKIEGKNVIALGGVTPESLGDLQKSGFAGAAMLGFIPWQLPLQEFKEQIACFNL